MKGFIKFSISVLCAFAITACEAKEPEMVGGLTGVVFNYSQDWIGSVHINGDTVGRIIDYAKVGDYKGGGGFRCCFELSSKAKTVEVLVKTTTGDYKSQAIVEQPWSEHDGYAGIHILPGRKIVIEITPGHPEERFDLLNAQVKALGLKKEIDYNEKIRQMQLKQQKPFSEQKND